MLIAFALACVFDLRLDRRNTDEWIADNPPEDTAWWWDSGTTWSTWQDPTPDSFEVDHFSDRLEIVVHGGEGLYNVGIANTGDPRGWTGEDCYLGDGKFNLCHQVSAGGRLRLETVETPIEVVPNQTTKHGSKDAEDLTFVVSVEDQADCWVFGQDLTYYQALGCTELQ